MQKYDEVVKDTNQILHLDPNSVQARALLGRALKVLNDHKKAEEQLSIAVLLDATQANLYIGNAYPIDFNMKQRLILFFLLVYVTVCLSVCLFVYRARGHPVPHRPAGEGHRGHLRYVRTPGEIASAYYI